MDIKRVIEDGTQVGSFVKIENLWGTIARWGKKDTEFISVQQRGSCEGSRIDSKTHSSLTQYRAYQRGDKVALWNVSRASHRFSFGKHRGIEQFQQCSRLCAAQCDDDNNF